MPLAQSIELPPPKPTMESMSCEAANSRPFSTIRESGLEVKSEKQNESIPAAFNNVCARSARPVSTMARSETISVR